MSFYQHFVNTFISSPIPHSRFIFFLSQIIEEDLTTIGTEKLNGRCDSDKTNSGGSRQRGAKEEETEQDEGES